jgi:maleamate amidohydrolase
VSKASVEDIEVYQQQGWGQPLGFGATPALVVIDFTVGFADPAVLGGGNISSAIERTQQVLAAARAARIPVAFSRHVYEEDGSDRGLFNRKAPVLNSLTPESRIAQIVPSLAPLAGELILDKRYPSIFFRTDFASWLTIRQVDTLIITGCTTSGCIRASAVDCLCSGFRPIVLADCVGDRAIGPHEANLFDLRQKYADVVDSRVALERLGAR